MATKKCPFCAEKIQKEAIKCKHCGEMLTSPTAPKEAGTLDVDPDALENWQDQAINKWKWRNPYLVGFLSFLHPLGLLLSSVPAFFVYLLVWFFVWSLWPYNLVKFLLASGFGYYAYHNTRWKNAAIEKYKFGLPGTGVDNPKRIDPSGEGMKPMEARVAPEKQFQLVEVVELTSLNIFANSMAQVRAIAEQNVIPTLDPDKLNKEARELLLELVIFSLHLVDRIAFAVVGPEKRSRFMSELDRSVSSNLMQSLLTKEAPSEAKLLFRDHFLALYEERQQFYSTFELPSGKETALKGTLFWEAAKGFADVYFPDDAESAAISLSITFGNCAQGIKGLRVRLAGLPDF